MPRFASTFPKWKGPLFLVFVCLFSVCLGGFCVVFVCLFCFQCHRFWQEHPWRKVLPAVNRGHQPSVNKPTHGTSTTRTGALRLLREPARIQTDAPRSTTPLFPAVVSTGKKPGCLSEKEAVACCRHVVERICCATEPQPSCVKRPKRRKMWPLSAYVLSALQFLAAHVSVEHITPLKVITD